MAPFGLHEAPPVVMCRVKLIASMTWKRRLSEQSCLSPSHHTYQQKKMKCKLNMIHLGRYHLIEALKGDMKTELCEALP